MATYNAVETITLPSGEDLTAGIYKLATINSSGNVIVNTTANGSVVGVIAANATGTATGLPIPVALMKGRLKALAGGSFNPGDLLESDNAGKIVVFADTADHVCVGRAVAAGASGSIVAFVAMQGRVGGT